MEYRVGGSVGGGGGGGGALWSVHWAPVSHQLTAFRLPRQGTLIKPWQIVNIVDTDTPSYHVELYYPDVIIFTAGNESDTNHGLIKPMTNSGGTIQSASYTGHTWQHVPRPLHKGARTKYRTACREWKVNDTALATISTRGKQHICQLTPKVIR